MNAKSEDDTINLYRPSQFVDTVLAGDNYHVGNMSLAPFMAGSLREIVLSVEFAKCPKTIRRKIMHLSFLMHTVCRYGNFEAIYNIHCEILDDISSERTSWDRDEYFESMEGKILSEMLEEKLKYSAEGICEVEMKT